MEKDKNLLLIGAARIKINIPVDFFPYESFRGRYFTGLHDDIYGRCIRIENNRHKALIMSMELGDLGDIEMWLQKISEASGVPEECIFLTVTHTHGAPHVSDSYCQKVADVGKTALFGEYVMKAALEAADTAKSNMRPGRLGYGTGQCDINVNRDLIINGRSTMAANPHGLSDKTVAVMKFEDLNGAPIAYFINYAVHGAVMFDSKPKDGGMLVTGDLPGETSRQIENRYGGGVVALWTSGAAGDQNPRYTAVRKTVNEMGEIERTDALEAGYLLCQVQAESLAEEVMNVAGSIGKMTEGAGIKGIHKKFAVPGQIKSEHPFDLPEDFVNQDGEPVNMHLSLLLINNIAFVGVPGEPVCSIGMHVKNALPYRNVVVVAHCNGSISYLSDSSGFENRTFEAVVSHVKRGCAEDAIINGANEMIAGLEGN
ncbi:MAG: hypothetical protein HGA22_14225 [Clostridiales bacterium]|nr:hypothetical protein [Clostridiales bacterium]